MSLSTKGERGNGPEKVGNATKRSANKRRHGRRGKVTPALRSEFSRRDEEKVQARPFFKLRKKEAEFVNEKGSVKMAGHTILLNKGDKKRRGPRMKKQVGGSGHQTGGKRFWGKE